MRNAIDMFANYRVIVNHVSPPLSFDRWIAAATIAICAVLPVSAANAQSDAVTQESATRLNFSDFFTFPVGPKGLQIKDTLNAANGKRVQISGYMVLQERALPGQFLLTPRPVTMSQHADGEADDLPPATLLVQLDPAQASWVVPHARGLIEIQGVLRVGRLESSDGRVVWAQILLGPDATRSMSPIEYAMYLHNQQHRH